MHNFFSIEGISHSGKTTLIKEILKTKPEYTAIPNEKEKEKFSQFVKLNNIELNPLKKHSAANKEFNLLLKYEVKKDLLIEEILLTKNIISIKDYLSFFTSAYAQSIMNKTNNTKQILDTIYAISDLEIFNKPTRLLLDIDPSIAIQRLKENNQKRNEYYKLNGSEKKLKDYLTIEREFKLWYAKKMEPENTHILENFSVDESSKYFKKLAKTNYQNQSNRNKKFF